MAETITWPRHFPNIANNFIIIALSNIIRFFNRLEEYWILEWLYLCFFKLVIFEKHCETISGGSQKMQLERNFVASSIQQKC